jgi:hypothetical protein
MGDRAGAEVCGDGGCRADGWRGRVSDNAAFIMPVRPVARFAGRAELVRHDLLGLGGELTDRFHSGALKDQVLTQLQAAREAYAAIASR